MAGISCVLLSLCLTGVTSSGDPAQQPPGPSEGAVAAAAATDERRAARLIGDLSDPRWAVRERASTELTELGPTAYGPLREAFHRDERYEVRRRVRRIVQDIYLFEAIQKRGGFLGIGYYPRTKSREFPQIPEGHQWIYVREVKRHSGAARAGLRRGDLIRSINGQPLKIGGLSFPEWIGNHPPRTRVRLGVVRGRRQFEIEAVLGIYRPEDMKPEDMNQSADRALPKAKRQFETWWRTEFDPEGNWTPPLPEIQDPEWRADAAPTAP